jgi:hypothetical protein
MPATHFIQYCNAALGKLVALDYDPVSHGISNVNVTIACTGGLTSGTDLYSHDVGDTRYTVKVQNSAPYAYVTSFPIGCVVIIDSIDAVDPSTNESSDGSIVVHAHGNGALLYMLTETGGSGLRRSYQVSNSFTGLKAGSYSVSANIVLTYPKKGCQDSEIVNLGYDEVVCTIALGNITTVKPTTMGGTDGTITVNTLTNPAKLTVEYRLDAGAWQDSPLFGGLSAGTYNVQVRYKDFPSCSDNRNVDVQNGISCDLFIQTVRITHEQSKFADDGILEIIATGSNGAIEYSIDGGVTYQDNNIFTGLHPGVYAIKVQDAGSCSDSDTAEVLPFKSPYFVIPIANSHRFVVTSGPGIDTTRQSFDNKLFADMRFPGVDGDCYHEKVNNGQTRRIQWRTNYERNTLEVFRKRDGVLIETIPCSKVKDFTRQIDSTSAQLTDGGSGKTQLFFSGELPEWAVIGQAITISATSTVLDNRYEIEDILPGVLAAAGYTVLILNVAFPTTGVINANLNVEYDIQQFDVWEATLDWPINLYPEGEYYMIMQGFDLQFDPITAVSEPVETAVDHPDMLLLRAKNNDNAYNIFYDTGIEHVLLIPGELSKPVPGGEEVNHQDSQNRLIKIMEIVTRNPTIILESIPFYLGEKLALYAAHDHFVVDNVDYGKQDEKVEIEYFESDMLCRASLKIRQTDFVAENTDDFGDVDTPTTVMDVNGVLLRINP